MSPRTIEVPVRAWVPWDTKLRIALVRLSIFICPPLARRLASGAYKYKVQIGNRVSVEYVDVEVAL